MSMRSIVIELKVDFSDDEERWNIMRKTAREAARNMIATAALVSDKRRQPEIAIHSSDYFEGIEEINLMDED